MPHYPVRRVRTPPRSLTGGNRGRSRSPRSCPAKLDVRIATAESLLSDRNNVIRHLTDEHSRVIEHTSSELQSVIDTMEESIRCPVCLDYTPFQMIQLPCGQHYTCLKCSVSDVMSSRYWFVQCGFRRMQLKVRCPVCRASRNVSERLRPLNFENEGDVRHKIGLIQQLLTLKRGLKHEKSG